MHAGMYVMFGLAWPGSRLRREPGSVVSTVSRVLLDYPHLLAGHCASGALRDLMTWAGLGWDGAPSESLAFGIGGDLGFTYLRAPEVQPPVYLVGRGPDLELDALGRLDAEVELRSGDDPVAGWQWVKAELDAGRPTMVWADIGDLPYLRVRLRMSRHDIVVVGYDDAESVAFVADNDRADIQRVPFEELARARSSTSFPGPTRHTTFVVDWPRRLPALVGVAREALEAAGHRMLDGSNGLPVARMGAGGVVAGGLGGVAVLADDVHRWSDLWGAEGADLALRSLGAFIEKAGTGGGLFRRLQGAFCQEVAERTGCEAAGVAADAYARCAQAWSAVAASAVGKAPLGERVRVVGDLAAALYDLEEAAAGSLLEAAESLA